jgi:hypothetical protein
MFTPAPIAIFDLLTAAGCLPAGYFSERFAHEIYQSPEMLTVNRDEFVNVVQAGLESDAE